MEVKWLGEFRYAGSECTVLRNSVIQRAFYIPEDGSLIHINAKASLLIPYDSTWEIPMLGWVNVYDTWGHWRNGALGRRGEAVTNVMLMQAEVSIMPQRWPRSCQNMQTVSVCYQRALRDLLIPGRWTVVVASIWHLGWSYYTAANHLRSKLSVRNIQTSSRPHDVWVMYAISFR